MTNLCKATDGLQSVIMKSAMLLLCHTSKVDKHILGMMCQNGLCTNLGQLYAQANQPVKSYKNFPYQTSYSKTNSSCTYMKAAYRIHSRYII